MGNSPAIGGESEMNRHTHPTTNSQQRISDFLYSSDTINLGFLPDRFLEFCRASIEQLRGETMLTEPIILPTSPMPPVYDGDTSMMELQDINQKHILELNPTKSDRSVIAVDTSTIRLGELEDGTLCALRGAAMLLEEGRYKYVRYGPFVFSLGNNSLTTFQVLTSLGLPPFTGEPNIEALLKRIRNLLERWLQSSVMSAISDGFILMDGSLTAGTPDNPAKDLEQILQTARQAGNIVVAISKKTKLRVQNESITKFLEKESNPCLLNVDAEITKQFPPYPVRFLGRVFVGKLAKAGFPFRMDVDRELSIPRTVLGLCELAGTDIVDQGYPETLRLAHILSTFTASDVLAIQAFAAARFGVQLVPKIALRRSLFGPFGTAWEAWH